MRRHTLGGRTAVLLAAALVLTGCRGGTSAIPETSPVADTERGTAAETESVPETIPAEETGIQETDPPETVEESAEEKTYTVYVHSRYSVVRTDTGYAVWEGDVLLGEYADFRECRYVDKDGVLQTNYILVQKRNRGTYFLFSLTENGIQRSRELRDDYDSVAFYEDYMAIDNFLYDGNFQMVGFLYGGQVISASPIKEGGVVWFVTADGVTRAYAYAKQIPVPADDEAVPWENSRTHGFSSHGILQTEGGYVLAAGTDGFLIPDGIIGNIVAAASTDTEQAVVLYEEENVLRVCATTFARSGPSGHYFLVTDCPAVEAGTFGSFTMYSCTNIPYVTWFVGEDGVIHAFQGRVTPVCDGNLFLYTYVMQGFIDFWDVYDANLNRMVRLQEYPYWTTVRWWESLTEKKRLFITAEMARRLLIRNKNREKT